VKWSPSRIASIRKKSVLVFRAVPWPQNPEVDIWSACKRSKPLEKVFDTSLRFDSNHKSGEDGRTKANQENGSPGCRIGRTMVARRLPISCPARETPTD
jgi:hypothetical protein